MPAGPGAADAEGVRLYGEADSEALASDLLNLGLESVSTQFGLDRARLDDLEEKLSYVEYRRATVQSIPNGTSTIIDFDAAPAIASGTWSETAGVVTVPLSGYYRVEFRMEWAAGATGIRQVSVFRNGAVNAIDSDTVSASLTTISKCGRDIYLAAGDTLRIAVAQNNGASLNIGEYPATGTKTPALTIRYLGAR